MDIYTAIEKVFYAVLLVSPIIALLALLIRFFADKPTKDNDASFYSGWYILLLSGGLFYFFSFLNYLSEPDLGFPKALYYNWVFITAIVPGFIQVSFLFGCFYGLLNVDTRSESPTRTEVVKSLLTILLSTGVGTAIWLIFTYVILPTLALLG